ncbi:MAG: RNA polymerase sigma factor [Candidatus Magasanikbacteria bacterium]|nr:RNA polymerase sigma factor [Candidatus Magasanikbacteria bacterium]
MSELYEGHNLTTRKDTAKNEGSDTTSKNALITRLFEQAKHNDESAWRLLLESMKAELMQRALIFTKGDESMAEDLLQNVFTKLWEKIEDIEVDNPRAYIHRMLTNKAISGKRKRTDVHLADVFHDAEGEEIPVPDTEGRNPEQLLLDKMSAEQLGAVLDSLNPDMKQICILHFLEGKKIREVAEQLKIPENTVKTKIFRARKIIAEAMERN